MKKHDDSYSPILIAGLIGFIIMLFLKRFVFLDLLWIVVCIPIIAAFLPYILLITYIFVIMPWWVGIRILVYISRGAASKLDHLLKSIISARYDD